MTLLVPSLQKLSSAVGSFGSQSGWIGVDVGVSAIKLAQVERRGDSWQLAGRWTIEHASDEPIGPQSLADGELAKHSAALRQSRRLFRGRRAAATLPTSHMDIRALDLPTGPWTETRAILDQELAADAPSEMGPLDYDAWQAAAGPSMTKILAVSVSRGATLRAAADLFAAGYDCSVIDAAPCALARAVSLCDPLAAQETVAALDIGHSSCLLTLVHEGRPAFCRLLRGCGMQALMQPLLDKLRLAPHECRQLFTRFGIPSESAGAPAARSTYQVISHGLEHLAAELRRTLDYARFQLRLSPQRIWLFGGGATIRRTPEFITEETGIPASPWGLSRGEITATLVEPLYGVAAGLSVLAWEDGKCT